MENREPAKGCVLALAASCFLWAALLIWLAWKWGWL